MATIKIKNLKLRTIIGILNRERENKQDIIINIKIKFDDTKASSSDNINDTIDYDKLTKKITTAVEESQFYLLEKLNSFVLDLLMEEKSINYAKVKIDKPKALLYADSVSLTNSRTK